MPYIVIFFWKRTLGAFCVSICTNTVIQAMIARPDKVEHSGEKMYSSKYFVRKFQICLKRKRLMVYNY